MTLPTHMIWTLCVVGKHMTMFRMQKSAVVIACGLKRLVIINHFFFAIISSLAPKCSTLFHYVKRTSLFQLRPILVQRRARRPPALNSALALFNNSLLTLSAVTAPSLRTVGWLGYLNTTDEPTGSGNRQLSDKILSLTSSSLHYVTQSVYHILTHYHQWNIPLYTGQMNSTKLPATSVSDTCVTSVLLDNFFPSLSRSLSLSLSCHVRFCYIFMKLILDASV